MATTFARRWSTTSPRRAPTRVAADIDRLRPALNDEVAARFAADLGGLLASDARLGLAVSGGPDSLALLALAAATLTAERLAVATVDHRLRVEAAEEAAMVAELCETLGLEHRTLTLAWADGKPKSGVQGAAREARYEALAHWAAGEGLDAIATGHHADDQAETLLMRLSRGAGIDGLAGIRAARPLVTGVWLVRPLLGWRRAELAEVVAATGWQAIDDPTNRDPAHERSRIRNLLSQVDGPDVQGIAASAAHLAASAEALDFAQATIAAERVSRDGDTVTIRVGGLPREWRRRLLRDALGPEPKGAELGRALDVLEAGGTCTLAGMKLAGGAEWRISPAPPRRTP